KRLSMPSRPPCSLNSLTAACSRTLSLSSAPSLPMTLPAILSNKPMMDWCLQLRKIGSETFARSQIAPAAEWQFAQHHAADAYPLKTDHIQPDEFAHAPDLALAALAQHETQLILVLPRNPGRLELDAVKRQAVVEQPESLVGQRAFHAHEIFLLDRRVLADELA